MPSFTLPFFKRKIESSAPMPPSNTAATQTNGVTPAVSDAAPISTIKADVAAVGDLQTVAGKEFQADAIPVQVTLDQSPATIEAASAGPAFDINNVLGTVDIAAFIVSLWLGLAVLWFALQLIRQQRFMARMKAIGITPPASLDGPIQASMDAIGLKRRPRIILSSTISGPMVTGLLRPMILLPDDFEAQFKPHQRNFALIHEMAHIKRGDLWIALVMLAFRALFWPNPLVHYAAHKMRVDQEAACDASVIAKTGGVTATHSYAETLIHAAKSAGKTKQASPLGLALTDDKQ
jgi:beta-lactamase regulating signal transducer with metallopeptidase domain